MKKDKIIKIIIIVCTLGVLTVIGYFLNKEEDVVGINSENNIMIAVEVKGEITNPAVYIVNEGERISDIIDLAGGLTNKSDTSNLNLAGKVSDGMIIYVPTKENNISKISLNTSTVEDLMKIPNINKSKAQAIVAYRDEHKSFYRIEELLNIKTIDESLYNQIKEYFII